MAVEKKYVHLMVFRCKCGAEHGPKPGTWEEQSAEAGALGWAHVYVESDKVACSGYAMRCGACVEALKAA